MSSPRTSRADRVSRHRVVVATVAAMACTTTTTPLRPASPPTVVAPAVDQDVTGMVRLALEREPFGAAPDSLFSPVAVFISNGREQHIVPRYAGVGVGGAVRITGMTGEVRPPFAWTLVTYRWEAADGTSADAKATFLLQQTGDRWRIRHVHSSLVLPWQGREP